MLGGGFMLHNLVLTIVCVLAQRIGPDHSNRHVCVFADLNYFWMLGKVSLSSAG